jgi:hypothetical protein
MFRLRACPCSESESDDGTGIIFHKRWFLCDNLPNMSAVHRVDGWVEGIGEMKCPIPSGTFRWRRVKKAQLVECKLRRLQEPLGLRWRPQV